MTRVELLKRYKIVATRAAKKGETILAVKNHGGDCSAVVVSQDMRFVITAILEKI